MRRCFALPALLIIFSINVSADTYLQCNFGEKDIFNDYWEEEKKHPSISDLELPEHFYTVDLILSDQQVGSTVYRHLMVEDTGGFKASSNSIVVENEDWQDETVVLEWVYLYLLNHTMTINRIDLSYELNVVNDAFDLDQNHYGECIILSAAAFQDRQTNIAELVEITEERTAERQAEAQSELENKRQF